MNPTDTTAPPAAPKTSNELAAERTQMAVGRTIMAADRSLMAWVRTGLSMISFGFTIYKILQGFAASEGATAAAHSPRTVGLFLTGLGTAAILMGTFEYWQRLQAARAHFPIDTWRPSFIMATIMSATGLFLFVGIISRLL
jgi:putative membrane protein